MPEELKPDPKRTPRARAYQNAMTKNLQSAVRGPRRVSRDGLNRVA